MKLVICGKQEVWTSVMSWTWTGEMKLVICGKTGGLEYCHDMDMDRGDEVGDLWQDERPGVV